MVGWKDNKNMKKQMDGWMDGWIEKIYMKKDMDSWMDRKKYMKKQKDG